MPRPSIWLGRTALVVASLAICLTAAEVGLRLAQPARSTPADLPTLRSVRELARPNVRGVFRGVLHETNRHGLRDRDYAIPKPAGTFRIAIIGDSFTMGSGVVEAETYPAVVEEQLGPTVEVLNLGVAGFDFSASLNHLKRVGLAYDPDLIVYGWTSNDVEGEGYRMLRERRPLPQGRASSSHLWRFVARHWAALRDDDRTGYVRELEQNYFHNPPVWSRFTRELSRLRTLARARNVCAVVLLHPYIYDLDDSHPFTPIYDAVEEAAQAAGLYVARSFHHFEGRRASSLWVAPHDLHPNATGHQLLAAALLEAIPQLPPHCTKRLAMPGIVEVSQH